MANRVENQEREMALNHGAEVVKHYLNRVRDSVDEAERLLASKADAPDMVINEINRAANIAGRAQQASNIWKGLAIDFKKKGAAPEAEAKDKA